MVKIQGMLSKRITTSSCRVVVLKGASLDPIVFKNSTNLNIYIFLSNPLNVRLKHDYDYDVALLSKHDTTGEAMLMAFGSNLIIIIIIG